MTLIVDMPLRFACISVCVFYVSVPTSGHFHDCLFVSLVCFSFTSKVCLLWSSEADSSSSQTEPLASDSSGFRLPFYRGTRSHMDSGEHIDWAAASCASSHNCHMGCRERGWHTHIFL